MKNFNEEVYFQAGCKGSKPWDLAFLSILDEWRIKYKIFNLKSNPYPSNKERIFIGRINEHCKDFKKEYKLKSKYFKRMWPEPLAMFLYDDKFAQVDFLKNYPTPFQKVVRSPDSDLDDFEYPVVIKKAEGSASKNVHLTNDKSQIKFYPCLVQEFCKNNQGDYRIVIIGNYAMGSFRYNRIGDFRASGSNCCEILSELPMEAVYIAYDICKKNNFVTMAFDFLKLNDKWVIAEMSYTYPIYSITRDCKFYIDLSNNDKRIETTPDPARLVLSEILKT